MHWGDIVWAFFAFTESSSEPWSKLLIEHYIGVR